MSTRKEDRRWRRPINLARTPAPLADPAREIYLLQAVAEGVADLRVDRDAGVIYNVSVITEGVARPAIGDPFAVDRVMIEQVRDGINAGSSGARCRLSHPELESVGRNVVDGIWCLIGRVRNARIITTSDGLLQVRADVHLGTYAKRSPKGNLWDYVCDLAEGDPTIVGMSIRANPAPFEPDAEGVPTGRIAALIAVDFVEFPGGNNRDGLLAGQPNDTPRRGDAPGNTNAAAASAAKETVMELNDKQMMYLYSIGLKSGASKEEVKAFVDKLNEAQDRFLRSLASMQPPPPPAPDPETPAESAAPAPAPSATPPATTTAGSTGPAVNLNGQPAPAAPAAPVSLTAQQRELALREDADRRTAILSLARERHLPDTWARGLCDRGVTVIEAQRLADLAATMELARPSFGSAQVGDDRNLSTLAPAIADCLCLSAGVQLIDYGTHAPMRDTDGRIRYRQPHDRAAQIGPQHPVMLAKRFLREIGCPGLEDMSESRILQLAINRKRLSEHMQNPMFLAMGTSDFVHALDTSIRNSIRTKYWQHVQESHWMLWCQRTTNPDYRATGYVVMSEVPDLLQIEEGEDVRMAVIKDSKQTIIVYRFGRKYHFTQQSLKNGLQQILVDFPNALVNAARRKENLLPVATLIANPTMADGKALFHAEHGNYVANDAGAAPSFTTLNAMAVAMATQTGLLDEIEGDGSPQPLEVRPSGLLVPKGIEASTRTLINSPVDITKNNNTPNDIPDLFDNPPGQKVPVIGLGQLSAASTTAWYGFARPGGVGGGMVLAFLEGEESPIVDSETDFDSDDYKVKIVHNLGSGPSDHRGLYKNEGITVGG